jgi:hypothetical protein
VEQRRLRQPAQEEVFPCPDCLAELATAKTLKRFFTRALPHSGQPAVLLVEASSSSNSLPQRWHRYS